MSFLLLLNEEFSKSILRSGLEKFINLKVKKNNNKYVEILSQISIRFVASILVIQLYEYLPEFPILRKVSSYLFLFLFIYFIVKK